MLSLVKYLIMISLVLISTALDILTYSYIGLSSPSTSNSHAPKDKIVFVPLANRSEKKEVKSNLVKIDMCLDQDVLVAWLVSYIWSHRPSCPLTNLRS